MPHLSQEQIESANRVDLAGFLLSHGERLKNMGSQRLWEKHQVWVDGYRWYSHYDSKGGYAVSFVMRYFDMDFQTAVRELIGEQYTVNDTEPRGYPKKEKQGLEVPPKNATMQRVYAYLIRKPSNSSLPRFVSPVEDTKQPASTRRSIERLPT